MIYYSDEKLTRGCSRINYSLKKQALTVVSGLLLSLRSPAVFPIGAGSHAVELLEATDKAGNVQHAGPVTDRLDGIIRFPQQTATFFKSQALHIVGKALALMRPEIVRQI